MCQWFSLGRDAVLVLAGAATSLIGGCVLHTIQTRRDEKLAARAARAEGERRIARIRHLAEYGAEITDNRDEQFKLSHACADEFDELAKLVFAGQQSPPVDAEDLQSQARTLYVKWMAAATRLNQSPREGAEAIRNLAPEINRVALGFRQVVRAAWPRA